jgi:hypothetical protein
MGVVVWFPYVGCVGCWVVRFYGEGGRWREQIHIYLRTSTMVSRADVLTMGCVGSLASKQAHSTSRKPNASENAYHLLFLLSVLVGRYMTESETIAVVFVIGRWTIGQLEACRNHLIAVRTHLSSLKHCRNKN